MIWEREMCGNAVITLIRQSRLKSALYLHNEGVLRATHTASNLVGCMSMIRSG